MEKITLYHGTSTFWLKQILIDGLGAQEIIEKYNVIEFGHHVKKIARKYLNGFEVMTYDLPYLEEMLMQKVGTGLGSWSHGATFLSSCPVTASRYAHNEWGSEILSRCFKFVRAFSEIQSDLSLFFEDFSSLFEVYQSAHNPVLLQLDLEKNQILDEAGRDGEFLEKAIRKIRLSNDLFVRGGPAFRLKSPVKISLDQVLIPIAINSDNSRFLFLKVSEFNKL